MARFSCRAIADELKVSPRTVYRVLNNNGPVSSRMQKKVVALLNRYGYYNSRIAPGQLVIFDLAGFDFNHTIILPVMERLAARGFHCVPTDHRRKPAAFADAVAEASAVIWGGVPGSSRIQAVKALNPGATQITVLADGGDVALGSDYAWSGCAAADSLIGNGHRRLLAVGSYVQNRPLRDRLLNFIGQVRSLAPEAELAIWEYAANRPVPWKRLLSKATGVFLTHQMYVKPFEAALEKLHLRVPEDLSVIVHDPPPEGVVQPYDLIYSDFEALKDYIEYFIVNRPMFPSPSGIRVLLRPLYRRQGGVRLISG